MEKHQFNVKQVFFFFIFFVGARRFDRDRMKTPPSTQTNRQMRDSARAQLTSNATTCFSERCDFRVCFTWFYG